MQAKQRGTYPENWPAIALVVKDAAGWSCIRCGHVHCVASGHMLTVHHFDGNKSNSDLSNLMALCQRCHLSVQARVDPHVPLIFKPSTWALPYVAAFYASGRGMPNLTTYDLDDWRKTYEQEAGKSWPEWAPRATDNERKPSPHSRTTPTLGGPDLVTKVRSEQLS